MDSRTVPGPEGFPGALFTIVSGTWMLMLFVLCNNFYDLNLFSKWQVKLLLLSSAHSFGFQERHSC